MVRGSISVDWFSRQSRRNQLSFFKASGSYLPSFL